MCRNYNVCAIPLVISIILGIIIGVLFFLGTITVASLAVPIVITLLMAGITLILLYVTVAFGNKETKECVCEYGKCLLLGGIVAILAATLSLVFTASLTTGSIIFALLIGIGAFAIILNFLSFVGLIVCLVNKNCNKMNPCCKFHNDYCE